jgi:hypothetical protein
MKSVLVQIDLGQSTSQSFGAGTRQSALISWISRGYVESMWTGLHRRGKF